MTTSVIATLPGSLNERPTHQGVRYLQRQGIASACAAQAATQEALHYAPGALAFLGYDDRRVARHVTFFRYDWAGPPRWETQLRSDARYPAVFIGAPEVLWLVDNGVEALALWSLLYCMRLTLPTILITTNCEPADLITSPRTETLVAHAKAIVITTEPTEQAGPQVERYRHEAYRRRLKAITRPTHPVALWSPFDGAATILELLQQSLRAAQ